MKKSRKSKRVVRSASKAAPRRKTVKAAKTARRASAGDPLDGFIVSGARSLGITIEPAWMPAVRANLQATLTLGGIVGEFPLPDDAEPASVFRA